jgi:hypothetical protein
MLFLAETKIDETFTDTQFKVNDFHFWRADRNQYGGGLVAICAHKLKWMFSSKVFELVKDVFDPVFVTMCF